MEGEPVKARQNTIFNTNLIWETDRASIKLMKKENLPVKLELLGVTKMKGVNSNDEIMDLIGYVLMPIRSIPILPLEKALRLRMKSRWLRLIGLGKEWRKYRPELMMSIMITNKEFLNCDKSLKNCETDSSSESVVDENSHIMITKQNDLFIKLLENEKLLQVGNIDTDRDIFDVKILLKCINNIEFLAQKPIQTNAEFFFDYKLLGKRHIRVLRKKINNRFEIKERISIHFRSTLKALQQYFKNVFFIPIEVHCSQTSTIGLTEIHFDDLIKITDLEEFVKRSNSFLEYDGIANINPIETLDTGDQCTNATLEYKFILRYESDKKQNQSKMNENQMPIADSMGGGDCILPISANYNDEEKCNSLKKDEVPLNRPLIAEIEKIPHLFSFNLKLKYAKFNLNPPAGIWQISFFHEKADTQRSFLNFEIDESDFEEENIINFNCLEIKLYFISQPDRIIDVIKSSEICFLYIRGPHNLHAKTNLNCKNLTLSTEESIICNILLKNLNDVVIALAAIEINLTDNGLNLNASVNITNSEVYNDSLVNATRTIVNEQNDEMSFNANIAYKMIEELDEWKQREQEKFLYELKDTENNFLNRIKRDWNLIKVKYETEYIEKSNALSTALKSIEHVQKSLTYNEIVKETENMEDLKRELEKSFKNQLIIIQDHAKCIEKDLTQELQMKELKFKELNCCNEQLREENCELRKMNECLQAEINELRFNLVSKNEVEKLVTKMVRFDLCYEMMSVLFITI